MSTYTKKINPNEFIGDSLETINGNFLNLQSEVCNLSSEYQNVTSFGVTSITGGINVNATPTTGNVTLTFNSCPHWPVTTDKIPLHLELDSAKRVSQHLSLSSSFIKHIRDITKTNSPMSTTTTYTFVPQALQFESSGTCTLADGSVYIIKKTGGGSTAIYNPKSNSYSSAACPSSGTWKTGAILLTTGKLLLVPSSGTTAQIYDPLTNSISSAGGSHWNVNGTKDWGGAVSLLNGKVYLNARDDASQSIIYDPQINNTSTTPAVTNGSGSCVLLLDGRVYRIPGVAPQTNQKAQIYDPSTNTYSTAFGTYPVTTNGFFLGQLLADGRIFIGPNDSACGGGRIFDPVATTDATALITAPGNWFTGSLTKTYYGGITLLADGRVLLVPQDADSVIIYNTETNTTETLSLPLIGGKGLYSGMSTLSNGKQYTIISNANKAGILIHSYHQRSFSLAAISSPHFNKAS